MLIVENSVETRLKTFREVQGVGREQGGPHRQAHQGPAVPRDAGRDGRAGLRARRRVVLARPGRQPLREGELRGLLGGRQARGGVAPILAKGMAVTVEGRLRFSRWERDGQVRTKLDVVVTDIVLPPRQAACRPPAQQGWQPDRQGWG